MARVGSFYGLLGVTTEATTEEIKLAFKRRALQVHPDKGGSKEAFHLVYQAFENLADPEARKRYDTQRATSASSKQKAKPKKSAQPEKRAAPPKPEHTSQASGTKQSETPRMFSHKLLTRLYELLKRLPREVRNDIIQKEFTQKQRMLFEKWIVNQREAETKRETEQAASMMLSSSSAAKQEAPTCHTGLEPPAQEQTIAANSSTLSLIPAQPRSWKKRKQKVEVRGVCKCTRGSGYTAQVGLDSLCILSRECDLPTAIEFLIILSSVKQRMQGSSQDAEAVFRSRLAEALEQSLAEHARSYDDLSPRFTIQHRISYFLGPNRYLRSPTIRSLQEVAKLRSRLAPFRECVLKPGQHSGAIIWRYGPSDLEGVWARIQEVVKEMWENTGEGRSAAQLRRMRALYKSRARVRSKHLQRWEQQHMGKNDKSARVRPRVKRKRQAIDKLLLVRNLLLRWHNALKKQEQMAECQRRKVLRQRKKEQTDRRRLEVLKRKRAREEQAANRLRREALRKRMKADLTMDEIFSRLDAKIGSSRP
ncbi:DnaJ protein homolog 2 [Durusdinium trenchii]|uniref:DnaJ protein homolog 2 n=1 Tax=Durusdinium trenchii TaxID=1381693 RepID=A0ABP0RL60_9DINO